MKRTLYTTTNLVSGIEAVMKCDTKEKMDERAKGLAGKHSGDYIPPSDASSTNNLKLVAIDSDFKRKM